MRNLAFRLTVAVITCAVGIATGSMWSSAPNTSATAGPCREGLVVVEHQPDAPVGIVIQTINCSDGFANISYRIESRTPWLIESYEIRRSSAHHGIVDHDAHGKMSTNIRPSGMNASAPGSGLESLSSGEGLKLSRGWFREPVDEVRYYVWSVTLTDGTEWHRASASD